MRRQPAQVAPTVILPRVRATPWIVLLVLTLGYFMILLDTSIVNVALPDMERGLHAGFDQILWVVNGYVLVFAVLLITAGRLGDLLGPKRLFIAGLALFTLASAACGLAPDAGPLILFRGLPERRTSVPCDLRGRCPARRAVRQRAAGGTWRRGPTPG